MMSRADRSDSPADSVADGVWSLRIPMPDHLPYSLCYLVEDGHGGLHVIDPGWDSPENREAFGAALGAIGKSHAAIASIVVTHLHRDHLAAAGHLAQVSDAPILMHRTEAASLEELDSGRETITRASFDAWGVPAERRDELAQAADRHREDTMRGPDVLLDDGEDLPIEGRRLTAIWTPGHTAGHLCVRAVDERLLFTGDHVLPTIFSGIGIGGGRPQNPIADYLSSLARVTAFDDHEALPGHEHRFTGLAERCRVIAEHHLVRSREVQAALARDPDATLWSVAAQLSWTAGWGSLAGFMLLSALAQTEMHLDFVRSGAPLDGLDSYEA